MNIQKLTDDTTNAINSLQVALREVTDLSKQRDEVEAYEREVRDMEKTILEKYADYEKKMTELKRQQAEIQVKREELAEKERKIIKGENIIPQAREQVEVMNKKIIEMKLQESKLQEKIDETDKILTREKELEKRILLASEKEKELRDLKDRLDKQEDSIVKQQTDIDSQKTILISDIKKKEKELEEIMFKVEEAKNLLKAEKKRKTLDLDKREKELQQKESDYIKRQQEISSREERVKQIQKELNEKELILTQSAKLDIQRKRELNILTKKTLAQSR